MREGQTNQRSEIEMTNNQRLPGQRLSNSISNIRLLIADNTKTCATKLVFTSSTFRFSWRGECSVCFNWANCANPLHCRPHWPLFESERHSIKILSRNPNTNKIRNPVSAVSYTLCHNVVAAVAHIWKHKYHLQYSIDDTLQDINSFVYCIDPLCLNTDVIFPLYSSYNWSLENWPLCDLIPVFNPLLFAQLSVASLTPYPCSCIASGAQLIC